jgi:hypothetical protein
MQGLLLVNPAGGKFERKNAAGISDARIKVPDFCKQLQLSVLLPAKHGLIAWLATVRRSGFASRWHKVPRRRRDSTVWLAVAWDRKHFPPYPR